MKKIESVLSSFSQPNRAQKKIIKKGPLNSKNYFFYEKKASEILKQLMQYRRIISSKMSCSEALCSKCSESNLPPIIKMIQKNQPIHFILPAFPGKSPNLEKVLGFLPDMAERCALIFLNKLCLKIKDFYAPGAKILLCSDGRVFSDLVGIKEKNITFYQEALNNMITKLKLNCLATANMEELFQESNFLKARQKLITNYSQPLEALKQKIKQGAKDSKETTEKESHNIYCGITRFLFEDSLYPGQKKSRTALQKECKERAYGVIQRSNAWSDFLAQKFPNSVRLSIHPQSCGAKKLGIRLLGNETWTTPWHSVAVETKEGFILMKRKDAEKISAKIKFNSSGKVSHYSLLKTKSTEQENS